MSDNLEYIAFDDPDFDVESQDINPVEDIPVYPVGRYGFVLESYEISQFGEESDMGPRDNLIFNGRLINLVSLLDDDDTDKVPKEGSLIRFRFAAPLKGGSRSDNFSWSKYLRMEINLLGEETVNELKRTVPVRTRAETLVTEYKNKPFYVTMTITKKGEKSYQNHRDDWSPEE